MHTSSLPAPRALIAEDEPLLAQALQLALQRAWPELKIVAVVADGLSAVTQTLELRPDILFLDIRMPGQSGLQAAAELVDCWPEGQAFPAIVFVTAYDQYAVQAFEAQAIDYLLKPVQTARLAQTVQRLRQWWQQQRSGQMLNQLEVTLQQLLRLQSEPPATAANTGAVPLSIVQASMGQQIHMLPVQDIVYLEAADKYLRVLTAEHEYLLRTPLKDLLPQLDSQQFWQIHRATVVRASAIASAQRDEAGRLWLALHQRPEKLQVSRMYSTRFKAM